MADQTEAKLLDDLQIYVDQTETLGAAFAPPKAAALAANVLKKIDQARPLVSPFQQKSAAESLKRHERAAMHKTFSPLLSDIIKYCKSAGWETADLNRLKSFNRELKGRPAKDREDDPATPDVNESQAGSSPAQTSYPSRTEHLANAVETLRASPNYPATESRFVLTTLDALENDCLRRLN